MLDPTSRTVAAPHWVPSTEPSVKTQRTSGPAEERCERIRWIERAEVRIEGRGTKEMATGSTV